MSSRQTVAKLASEVHALRRQDGSFDPTDLVEWAVENPKSDLHGEFLWNDAAASHEYRLWQARQLIKRYVVQVSDDGEPVKIPIISVPSLRKTGGSYITSDMVSANEVWRLEVLEEQKAKLRTARLQYEAITPEIAPVWRAIKRCC